MYTPNSTHRIANASERWFMCGDNPEKKVEIVLLHQRVSTIIFIVPPGNKLLCRRTTSKSQIKN